MPDDIRACCKRPKIESNKLCLGSGSSDEIYRHWFPVYYELTTLPINSEAVRHSPDVIARLRALGWDTSPQTFDAYWHRVNWISSQCQGRVLEIGCGMGNVTRWIAANPAVESIVALDVQGTYIATLKSFPWPKVTALCIDVSLEGQKLASYGPFETVVLAELIEHISLKQELTIVDAVRPYILGGARWVISTPIGFMSDPDHKRGFGPFLFRYHTRLLYGPIVSEGDNKIQHYVSCKDARPRCDSEYRGRRVLARVLGCAFASKPSTWRRSFLSLSAWRRRVGVWLQKLCSLRVNRMQ